MNILRVPIGKVQPNPFQVREAPDPEVIRALADDIRDHDLLQMAKGRRLANGDVQIAFGHSRFAAWQIAMPGKPFPVEVDKFSDRQMAEMSIRENVLRRDLSAIEKAKALRNYITTFGVTHVEAGKLFDIGESAVSNLLRMLELPLEVQRMVHQRKIPERKARTLVAIARRSPATAVHTAERMLTQPSIRKTGPECYHCSTVPDAWMRQGDYWACPNCGGLSWIHTEPVHCTRCEIAIGKEEQLVPGKTHCLQCERDLGVIEAKKLG